MTESEALEILNNESDDIYQVQIALKVAREALEEIQQYRAIGTVEELQALKENGVFTGIELAQIAANLMKLKKYMEIGTVEEFKFMKDNERKCEDCAGCTNWLCDCANERAKAIDEFTGMAYKMLGASDKDLYCSDIIDKIAEQMKGGATDE